MKRVLVLVEGQTEERFVKDVLNGYFEQRDLCLIPKIVATKRVKSGRDFKGGLSNYQKVSNDLQRLLEDTNAAAVTTCVDYYGLPADFPGMSTRPAGASALMRVQHVEREWETRVNHRRFHAYLMLHEFETLLFVDPTIICKILNRAEASKDLKAIRTSFHSPEEINEHPDTAPSKRILARLPAYQKTVHGPLAVQRTGLEMLRRECLHFADWLAWLETL